MNHISGLFLLVFLLACAACSAPASEQTNRQAVSTYAVHYAITPRPENGSAIVEMQVEQRRHLLRELSFPIAAIDPKSIRADGEYVVTDDRLIWRPTASGGTLRWIVGIPHKRGDGGFDAWLDRDFGLFRAEDVIPRARSRTVKGANSDTSMSFNLPPAWSAISEYSTLNDRISVAKPSRRFDQPSGWIAVGKLGVRRETIAGTRVAIAAPEGQAVRRMDMLALLNWILPEINEVLPDSLPRLTIVSAGDPMWRGGLSAPASIYIHSSRPLISENATSTLVHEAVHVALDISAEHGFDWIVEGLAEFYSLEFLKRGGAITVRRYQRALEQQAEWAKEAATLCNEKSKGATTALAVLVFRRLDTELIKKSEGRVNLDHVAALVANEHDAISVSALQDIVTELLQEPADALSSDALPGCERYVANAGK